MRGLRDLEIRLGKPVKVRLVRLEGGVDPVCHLLDRGGHFELRCHDPHPGYFWHLDALRRWLAQGP